MIKKVSSRGFAFDGQSIRPAAVFKQAAGGRKRRGGNSPQSGGDLAMANAVLLQTVMTLIVAALAAMLGGRHAALSALLGGLACVVPNALFALRLFWESRRPGGATMQGFFVGEFTKVAATLLILFVVARVYRELDWLALIVGFIAVLKSYFLMFLFGRHRA
jgi:ATP synthase protein I